LLRSCLLFQNLAYIKSTNIFLIITLLSRIHFIKALLREMHCGLLLCLWRRSNVYYRENGNVPVRRQPNCDDRSKAAQETSTQHARPICWRRGRSKLDSSQSKWGM